MVDLEEFSGVVMKLVRFLKDGNEKTGSLNDNIITELSCSVLEAININTDKLKTRDSFPIQDVKIKPPVSPSKIICIGLNYHDHARELNMEIPDEPVIFIKPSTGVIGHLDSILYPRSSMQVDYEVELALVISKEAHYVEENDADDYIGGYTILNDVTARDLQRKDVQWTRAKSFDTFCPIGPCIETDLDPSYQEISLRLNGEVKQNSNTKNMVFSPEKLVEFVSGIMTLKLGDIIATGTPPGVRPMQVGDVVEARVEGIGALTNYVKK